MEKERTNERLLIKEIMGESIEENENRKRKKDVEREGGRYENP